MYDIIIALIIGVQIYNLSYSLEVELFKQSVRYYAHRTYMYGYNFIKKWFKEEPKKEIVEPVVIEKYEDKYKNKFQGMENVELEKERLESLKNNILIETTPNGNVLMFYDYKNNSFAYYSDKVMPYRFLDTVGRKYVIQYRCKSIYITDKMKKEEPIRKSKIKIDVKDVSNRYMYLGKFANFSFLKKVKKGVTNKKLNMSFKDFKNRSLV